ncbi:hypothetical protein B0T21DRAFT_48742 [Apiosordaria backusii]|uniref:Uncharacterized protein n=1 Tax=Apiosordaria backusii TaxID=314023 RepID=A0AA40DZA4_9PEZI|nr:hypothetical protein B0T21DRAFT_48742 [Apiosordaria backusii]
MKPAPALDIPGPHHLPNRFAVRTAGPSGLKITGSNYKAPLHFLSKHASPRSSLRCSLHSTAHKKDNSPALVSVYKHQHRKSGWTTTTQIGNVKFTSSPGRGWENYQIILHRKAGNDECIDMPQTSNKTHQFRMRVNGREEGFEWIKGDSWMQELRTICKREAPVVKTGMQREKTGRLVSMVMGWVLVRVTGRAVQPVGKDGEGTPLGYDKQGREIVASWAFSRTRGFGGAVYFFQWWGSGATGELGEDFTRVAATTGATLYHEEVLRQAAEQRARNKSQTGM